jgi:hypothetical protein
MSLSKMTIGVATTDREPSSSRPWRPPWAASVELRRRGDVGERDRRAIPHREVGDARRARLRSPIGSSPSSCHCAFTIIAPSALPAARSNVPPQRLRHDGNRVLEHRVEVGIGPDPSGELSDDRLAIAVRASPTLDHRSSFRRKSLKLCQDVAGERTLLAGRRDDEHSDHALVGDQGDIREAPRSRRLDERVLTRCDACGS